MSKENRLLNNIIIAWESLEGDKNYSPKEISKWLKEEMKPAIDDIRNHLKRNKDVTNKRK